MRARPRARTRMLNRLLNLPSNWTDLVPLARIVRDYRRDDLSHDLVAGLVVGTVAIPQAVAYAFLAGLPAETGLYACLVPMVLYAVFGSSRHLVVGPVAVAALMVAATVREHAGDYATSPIEIAVIVSFQAGAFLWLLRAFGMGSVVNVLSHPVVSGFVNGAAILIIVSQLSPFTGIDMDRSSGTFGAIDAIAVGTVHGPTFAIGAMALLLLMAFPMLARRLLFVRPEHPLCRLGPLVVAIGAIVVVGQGGFDVATVGAVPGGLPAFTAPPFSTALWIDIAPSSAIIAIVAYVESFSIGTTLAGRQRQRVNSHQELIALGAANIGAAFSGAYPVAGSFSRSGINYATGARTPVSSLAAAAVTVIALVWFTSWLAPLPLAVLAAIVITSVSPLLDFRHLARHWKFYRMDVVTHLITFASVLAFGVETGLVTGVCVSIMLFVRRSSRPKITVVGRLGDTSHFRNIERYTDAKTWPEIVAVRIDENLYFTNVNRVEDRLLRIAERHPEAKQILLVCSAINFIDVSGLEMLRRVRANLASVGITMHLSDVKGPVMDQLRSVDFEQELGNDRIHLTADMAMQRMDKA